MYRPTRLQELIGQSKIKQSLQVCIDASKAKNAACPHMIFEGPAGLGKTTLAKIVAKELGTNCSIINGATVTEPATLIKALSSSKDRDLIFVDEIHSLPAKIAEMLYMPLEDNKLYIEYKDKKKDAYSVCLPLNGFTFIGATTNIGLVPKPLLDRMRMHFSLEYYDTNSISKIISHNAQGLGLTFESGATTNLAKRCKGVPRLANTLLEWIDNYCAHKQTKFITHRLIKEACTLYGVDEEGLNKNDRKYLEVLEKSGEPLGLKSLEAMTNITARTIENEVEPYLIRIGKIEKTKSGRQLAGRNKEKSIEYYLSQL